MSEQSAPPAMDYAATLRDYVANGRESALSRAYELGRGVVEGGFLELTGLHHQELAAMAAGADEGTRGRISRAAECFTEMLAPLEMALRSYRDTTARLLELNGELERRNEELASAKQAAEAANQDLKAFSYSVAHDLRAPLRAIDGFSQALLDDYAPAFDGEGLMFLERVKQSAVEMDQLIEDLLRLSQVSNLELHRERVSISDLAQGSVERLRQSHPERCVQVDIAPGLEVAGDQRLLQVAIENLIGNAWKFTVNRPDACIVVGSGDADGDGFFVRDNGAGFDAAHAHRLFGVFQRLHSDTEFKGTGIGLATVHRVVRRHGGQVRAEGAVGQGATFYVALPS